MASKNYREDKSNNEHKRKLNFMSKFDKNSMIYNSTMNFLNFLCAFVYMFYDFMISNLCPKALVIGFLLPRSYSHCNICMKIKNVTSL